MGSNGLRRADVRKVQVFRLRRLFSEHIMNYVVQRDAYKRSKV